MIAGCEALADDAWLLRDQAMPFVGRDAVRQALAGDGAMRLVAADVVLADSGDFAYSYGEVVEAAGGRAATGHDVHLWTRDASGHWRILVAVRPD